MAGDLVAGDTGEQTAELVGVAVGDHEAAFACEDGAPGPATVRAVVILEPELAKAVACVVILGLAQLGQVLTHEGYLIIADTYRRGNAR